MGPSPATGGGDGDDDGDGGAQARIMNGGGGKQSERGVVRRGMGESQINVRGSVAAQYYSIELLVDGVEGAPQRSCLNAPSLVEGPPACIWKVPYSQYLLGKHNNEKYTMHQPWPITVRLRVCQCACRGLVQNVSCSFVCNRTRRYGFPLFYASSTARPCFGESACELLAVF